MEMKLVETLGLEPLVSMPIHRLLLI